MAKATSTTKKAVVKSATKTIKPKPVAKTFDEAIKSKTAIEIIEKIEKWMKKNSTLYIIYDKWFIGIADSETTTKGLDFLQNYYAESKDIALAIEKYFHDKHVKNDDYKGGLTDKSKYLYIHKKVA